MSKQSLLEALKEIGRVLLLALVSYLLTEGVIDAVVVYFGGVNLDALTKAQIVGLVTTGLRALDKYLHELGKESDNKTLLRGLTQF